MGSKVNLHWIVRKPHNHDQAQTPKLPKIKLSPIEPDLPDYFDDLTRQRKMAILRPNRVFQPPTDIYETASHYIIKLEIAGLDPNQVTIESMGKELKIHGYRQEDTARKNTRYHLVEINYGEFERIVQLPERVNSEAAKASYTKGFLIIDLPKTSRTRSKSIPIDSE